MKLLINIFILVISELAIAEPKDFFDFGDSRIGKFRNCTPSIDCRPTKDCSQPQVTRDCSQPLDTRDCSACILRHPLGGCLERGNDPFCEAAKASQNALYAANKSACEAANASQKAVYASNKLYCETEKLSLKGRCETKKSAIKADCERLKLTQIEAAKPYEAAIHNSKKVALSSTLRPIPEQIKNVLAPYFRSEILDQVRWTAQWDKILPVQKYAMKLNSAVAITIDHIIFFKSEALANNDIGLWARELEHVKQYKTLGIDGFAQYYTYKESVIESLASKQSEYVCAELTKKGISCSAYEYK